MSSRPSHPNAIGRFIAQNPEWPIRRGKGPEEVYGVLYYPPTTAVAIAEHLRQYGVSYDEALRIIDRLVCEGKLYRTSHGYPPFDDDRGHDLIGFRRKAAVHV